MNRAILVITHGDFGIEIIKSAEMIMGEQEDVVGLGLRPGESVEDLRNEATEIVDKFNAEGKKTIVLCDLLGGSPSNVGLFLLSKGVEHVFTGLSLPMLIEILSLYKTEEDTTNLLETVQSSAVEGVKVLDLAFLKNR